MRIATNIDGLERVAAPGTLVTSITVQSRPNTTARRLALVAEALRSDYLVIHFHLPEVMFFSLALFLAPFHHCRIVTLDFFAGNVRGWMKPIARWSLGRVARFLVYFRDATVFHQSLGIPAQKFHYIPFKINACGLILAATPRDEGYIFSGGRSRRDFATLFAAVGSLGYPVKLLTGAESDLAPHGSSLKGVQIPANVEVLTNDSSPEYFVQLLCGARIVVIPLLPDTRTQSGIGVYLQAMAARKCVIISSGLGVSDVLTEDQAIIVPAGDAAALREAIRQVWEDPELRERYADRAARYAQPLGGEDELRRSVLNALP